MQAKELRKGDIIRLLDWSYHLVEDIEGTFVEGGKQKMRIATFSNVGNGEISYIFPSPDTEVEKV
jgi:hypothetical protein